MTQIWYDIIYIIYEAAYKEFVSPAKKDVVSAHKILTNSIFFTFFTNSIFFSFFPRKFHQTIVSFAFIFTRYRIHIIWYLWLFIFFYLDDVHPSKISHIIIIRKAFTVHMFISYICTCIIRIKHQHFDRKTVNHKHLGINLLHNSHPHHNQPHWRSNLNPCYLPFFFIIKCDSTQLSVQFVPKIQIRMVLAYQNVIWFVPIDSIWFLKCYSFHFFIHERTCAFSFLFKIQSFHS